MEYRCKERVFVFFEVEIVMMVNIESIVLCG